MQEVVTAPLMFFLSSILLGIGLLGIYDILRAFRAVIQHGLFFTAVEDILYFMFVAVISFWFLCTYNHGELRGFFFIGIFIGMFLYYIKISSYVISWLIYFFSRITNIFKIIYEIITKPMISIQRNIKWRLKKEKKNVTMALKKQIKRGGKSDNTAFAYMNLHQKSKKLEKEQQQVEAQIKKEKEKKDELKKKKEYIKTKEFIEKTATEKFGLLYPGEYLLKGSD